jgi:hypothetical protein
MLEVRREWEKIGEENEEDEEEGMDADELEGLCTGL